jgi:uncharacterized membrane protein YdjX (TVP38/TMEM64 family)
MAPSAPSFLGRLKKPHALLAIGGAAVALGVGLLVWKTGLLAGLAAVVAGLREAGPVIFFLSMALLPAIGFPMFAFTVTAGPVFGPTLGTGWVIGCSLLAVVTNLLLTHWLANRALRPLVSRLLARFEFRLPDDAAENAWLVTMIVRLTPGPPFWVQSYLLGVIRVPLLPYVAVSTLIMAGYIVALVLGGDAIASGNGRVALVAVGALAMFAGTLHLMHKRTVRRRAQAQLAPLAAK